MKNMLLGIKIFFLIEVLFLSISSVNAGTVEEYYQTGNYYYDQDNFTQAIFYYTQAIKIDPKHSSAYFNRGFAYYYQDNFTQAISDFTKAIEINPKNSDAYNNRGLAYCRVKEHDKAWIDVHKIEKLGGVVEPGFLKMLKKVSGRDR